MNKKNILQITAISSLALLGCNFASANHQTVFEQNNELLQNLNIGDIPAPINAVVDALATYQSQETTVRDGLLQDIINIEDDIAANNTAIGILEGDLNTKQNEINVLIANNINDPLIAVEQGNLQLIQDDIDDLNVDNAADVATRTTLIGDRNTSNQKLTLYDTVLAVDTGAVAVAEAAAASNAVAINQVIDQYANVNTNAAGLESIIQDLGNVTSGDQQTAVDAITTANQDFTNNGGAAAASVAEIATLVNAITTNLQTLPPISNNDVNLVETILEDGSYERVAIADLAANGIDGIITQAQDGSIHIGQNSLITVENNGVQELYAEDANNAAIDINVTNNSNLLIDGEAVATQVFAADADTAQSTALTTAFTNADTAQSTALTTAFTNADTAQSTALTTAFTNADTAQSTALTTAFTNADTAQSTALTTAFTNADTAQSTALTTAFTNADTAQSTALTTAFTNADANLQSQVDINRADIDRNARGIAMVAALQHTTVLPGMTHALDLSAARFEGETGLALNYARRINENVQINFGAAATSDFDESVIKAGIGVQW